MFRPSQRQVNNKYTLYDGNDEVVVRGISMLDFCIFIEGKGLEEASEYALVPIQKGGTE